MLPSPETMDRVVGWSCAAAACVAGWIVLAESIGWVAP